MNRSFPTYQIATSVARTLGEGWRSRELDEPTWARLFGPDGEELTIAVSGEGTLVVSDDRSDAMDYLPEHKAGDDVEAMARSVVEAMRYFPS
ncbi:hypothetical protein SUDANB1_05627 [Streptomyces sp. enrichment culture]|uniref:hypothetical protein n=1 Tax=Streptomyces sp. enrichment culture TaxID=1795815 RepID=UPI003F5643F7